MAKPVTPIKVTEGGESSYNKDETRFDHESFGLVRIGQVQGQTELFGSSVSHHNWIELTITRATKIRNLHRDRFYGGKELITIALSHAQLAEVFCSMNNGSGVPCTIQDIDNKMIPSAESSTISNKEVYLKEFEDDMKDVARYFNALEKKIAELIEKPTVSKAERKELADMVRMAKQNINSNMPFILKSFVEKTEDVVVEAKSEVEAFRATVINQMGIKALQDQAPKQIEGEQNEA
jgi:hypothetical protein